MPARSRATLPRPCPAGSGLVPRTGRTGISRGGRRTRPMMHPYPEGFMSKQLRTPRGRSTGGRPAADAPSAAAPADSNAQLLAEVKRGDGKVDGPMGRVFQRVLGITEGGADMAFTRDQLQRYLDQDLQLAEGEWFRGKKLSGVADALMKQLDTDGDGKVSWTEFRAFEKQTLATVAPGAGGSRAEVERAADARFGEIDENGDGRLTYDELFARTRGELPRGTDHKDLIAQLAARIALDAVDVDQRNQPVKKRALDRNEWKKGAGDMAD
ncbi:MAG: hypothetical protein D6798_17660 [Deltaproteobacteria bacterium]|nr:MAG: hypothetical protein D6798_17660 [Deltaproteobacteria bacterium]